MKKLIKRLLYWEHWPFYIIYIPMGFVWMYYAVKAKSFWFFSAVNPTLEFSGFEGETKREMYAHLPHELYPTTIFIEPNTDFEDVLKSIKHQQLHFPLIVKPDVGMHALMFRKIDDVEMLVQYHNNMPYTYIVQEFIDLPFEYSVFHVRYPNGNSKVTGFIQKEYLSVTGNGIDSLYELILKNDKARTRVKELKAKHQKRLHDIIPAKEKYFLSIAGNHNRGATFINLKNEIDEALNKVFEDISVKAGSFYYGRYDFKCSSLEDLKKGKNISILEFNGAGAEPNHIYDCGMSYFKAIKTLALHWKYMFEISQINKSNGVAHLNYKKGKDYLKRSRKILTNMKALDFSSL